MTADCGYTDAGQAVSAEYDWRQQYEETATRLHEAGDFAAADEIRTLVDGLAQYEREIPRLREFGEHYSGAAQDAWDRIVVLEAALREIMDLAGMTEGPYYPRAFSIAKAVLAAGSASPGGDET